MSILYKNIMSLCEQRNVSAYKMCSDINISKSIISDLKSGRKKGLSAGVASKIANYFGITVDYLLTGEQKEQPTAMAELLKKMPLIKKLVALSPEDLLRLEERVDTMLEAHHQEKK